MVLFKTMSNHAPLCPKISICLKVKMWKGLSHETEVATGINQKGRNWEQEKEHSTTTVWYFVT